jgi:small conductance mechanosensitive channel
MFNLDELLQAASATIATWTPKIGGAVAVLVIGWLFAGWARRFSRRALAASQLDDILIPFMSGMIHVTVIVIVGIAAVGVLGVNTTSFVAVLGAAGLAIALAFQDTFSNFSAGVMLLTFRPFDVGDTVEVGGSRGTVREVGIFSCLLTTPDNIHIRIPNSKIFGQTITNYSGSDTRRIDLVVGVSYDDDLGVAVKTCLDLLKADERVLADPEPVVAVNELGDSAVNLVVRPWVRSEDYGSTRWDLVRGLKEGLESAGCSLPYPQRDVHLHQVG